MNEQIQFWVYGGPEQELLFKMLSTSTFEGVYKAWTDRYGPQYFHFVYNSKKILPQQTPEELGIQNNDVVQVSTVSETYKLG